MAQPLQFTVSYAGTPLLSDVGVNAGVLLPNLGKPPHGRERDDRLGVMLQQRLPDLIDELDRLLPSDYLQDYVTPPSFPGKNLEALAQPYPAYREPRPTVRIGEWYYPVGASRWGVYRGLATSDMVATILAVTGAKAPAPFVMTQVPDAPGVTAAQYLLQTSLYMLPPRPLGVHGTQFDGLYLVTLVDERYWWQYAPERSLLTYTQKLTTWQQYLDFLAGVLGVKISFASAVPGAYPGPEPDSSFWASMDSAASYLDAVAYNTGCRTVRNLDGTYTLLRPSDGVGRVASNRGAASAVVRLAGGDLFAERGASLQAGDAQKSKNAVLPSSVVVTFPQYVYGDDPTPHFANKRFYGPQRPSAWNEASFGGSWAQDVPIKSGGVYVSGLTGVVLGSGNIQSDSNATVAPYAHYVHTTSKALSSGEAFLGAPSNLSGMVALAMQVAGDYYGWQAGAGLDEVYPGTFAWDPDGFHDVLWTYSDRRRLASTRVLRTHWNLAVHEMQHATVALSGTAYLPKGVGGHTVAQSIQDGISGYISPSALATSLTSGATTVSLTGINYLPTQNRWRGVINSGKADQEVVLFEGTSGGLGVSPPGPYSVNVVWRGIDGSIQQAHAAGAAVQPVRPDSTYGVNYTKYEKGQFVFPQEHGTLGVTGARVVPQTQTVEVLSNIPAGACGVSHYSGAVDVYDPTLAGGQFPRQETVWVVERNANPVVQGKRYDGQLAGFSNADLLGAPAPIYLVNEESAAVTTTTTTPAPCTGSCTWTWSASQKQWFQTGGSCGFPTTTAGPTTTQSPSCPTTTTSTTTASPLTCGCVPPTYCGSADGECTVTYCATGLVLSTPDCTGTTTTSTSTTKNPLCSTTQSPECTDCVWTWDGFGWFQTANGCTETGDCFCPSPNRLGGACGDQLALPCLAQQAPPCQGRCVWVYLDPPGVWTAVELGCSFTDGDCGGSCDCLPPSAPGACGLIAVTPCLLQCSESTTCNPCLGCQTTTQCPTCCDGGCTWGCDGANWYQTDNTCPGSCDCCPPAIPCTQTCQTAQTSCDDPPLCSTTTSTTSTTSTTTNPPCGVCVWTYGADCSLQSVQNSCTRVLGVPLCSCPTTPRCPTGGGAVRLACVSVTTTTTKAPCDTGACTYTCTDVGGAFPVWSLTGSTCVNPCGCCYNFGPCSSVGTATSAACQNPACPTTTTPSPTNGQCTWSACGGGSGWQLVNAGCNQGCSCSPPSQSPSCASCCDGATALTACDCTGTTTSTTSTTPDPCSTRGCLWNCVFDGSQWHWAVSINQCDLGAGCNCSGTTGPCNQGDTRVTACSQQGTTTTTSTTAAPPCGTCHYQCIFDGISAYHWGPLSNSCTGACTCQAPTGTCDAGNVGATTDTNCA